MRRAIESGVPDNKQYLHPLLAKNYGNWKYHDRPRPGVLHHVSHTGDEVWTVRAGTQRQMDVLHDPQAVRHRRHSSPKATCASPSAPTSSSWCRPTSKVAPLIEELETERLPRRRHRQLGVDDRPHPGLAALRHPRHRRLGRGQVADGRAATRSSSQRGDAQPRPPVHLLLRDQLRRPGRHRDHHPAHQAAEDQPRPRRQRLRAPGRRGALPGGGDPPGAGQRQALARSRREEVHLLRRLLPALPADADQRPRALQARDLGRRQELQRPRQADLHEDGRRRACPNNPPRWPEVVRDREEDPATSTRKTRGRGSACPTGSSASAGRASSRRPSCRSPST